MAFYRFSKEVQIQEGDASMTMIKWIGMSAKIQVLVCFAHPNLPHNPPHFIGLNYPANIKVNQLHLINNYRRGVESLVIGER